MCPERFRNLLFSFGNVNKHHLLLYRDILQTFVELRTKSFEIHGLGEGKSAILVSSGHFLSAILLFQFYTLF